MMSARLGTVSVEMNSKCAMPTSTGYLPGPMDDTERWSTERICHPRSSEQTKAALDTTYARIGRQIAQESK